MIDDSIKIIKKNFKRPVRLLPLGDLHLDAGSNIEHIKSLVSKIEKENLYTLLIGDIFDIGFYNNVETQQSRDDTLNDSLNLAKELFYPIKDRIFCIVEGNHDRRINKQTGFSVVKELCEDLEVPFVKSQGIISLKLDSKFYGLNRGNIAYTIAVTHGWGGGRSKGAKINKGVQFAEMWEGVDLFLMGHVHDPMQTYSSRYRFDSRTGKIVRIDRKIIILPAYQDYMPYASQMALSPSPYPSTIITFENKRKKIIVSEV